ncbi:hypothetical protein [Aliivibrio fischeri]|uniref:hypothetical protein n=1 Tax=Aliivibrio fischeri TaxID=668 RepID=UPI0007C5387E|nr:hypothetical protein [Aliivibrio fischeri]
MASIKTLGDAKTAPTYYCNSLGSPVWSGRHELEFNENMLNELRSFIVYEAKRQGHNDSLYGRIDINNQFFHTDFLQGWPQNLWTDYYQIGVSEQQKPVKLELEDFWPMMPI